MLQVSKKYLQTFNEVLFCRDIYNFIGCNFTVQAWFAMCGEQADCIRWWRIIKSLLTHCHRGHKWPFPTAVANSEMAKWFGQAVIGGGKVLQAEIQNEWNKKYTFFFLIKILGFL